MIKFFNNHQKDEDDKDDTNEKFTKTASYGPFFIALMQFIGCLMAEALNVWLVCRERTVSGTLLNYIALGVIAEIDDIYGSSI